MGEPRFETYPRAVRVAVPTAEDPEATVAGLHDGEYGWRLIAGNGEIVASGEGYATEFNAERGVRDVVATVAKILGREGEEPLEIRKADA